MNDAELDPDSTDVAAERLDPALDPEAPADAPDIDPEAPADAYGPEDDEDDEDDDDLVPPAGSTPDGR